MPPAKPAAPRRRNRKRKRRAVSTDSSSSSSDTSSSEGESPQKPIPTPAAVVNVSDEDDDDDTDSSLDSDSSESEVDMGNAALTPGRAPGTNAKVASASTVKPQKAPLIRRSPSPSIKPVEMPTFLPSKEDKPDPKQELLMKEKFRKFWLSAVADGFKDDLEEIRKVHNSKFKMRILPT